MTFGKIPMPQRREQRQICWCGDPDCPGEKRGDRPFSATEIAARNDMPSFNSPFGSNDRLREAMIRSIYLGSPDIFGEASDRSRGAGSGVPSSYTAARDAVKDHLLEVNHDTAWDDVVGNDGARAALMEAIEEPRKHPELYEYYGMKPPKGVLLFGPPGCGKTMFAKAAAAAVSRIYGTKAEVLVINGPSIQSPYVGQTEEKIRNIFAYAREYQAFHKHPLTVFFDEAEVLFPDRTGRTRRVAPWEESNVAQFLSEMDGMNSMGAFVILATNRPEAIDEALLRDGRCDRKIKVERPTKQAVEHILRKALSSAPLGEDIEMLVMAGTESFYNPHYVIQEGHVISAMLGKDGSATFKDTAINFCLEHVISGAMVAGVVRRAKSRAFARDRDRGERGGIKTADILGAVNEIFDENKGLEHSFAIKEFIEATRDALMGERS